MKSQRTNQNHALNYYEILGLPQPLLGTASTISKDDLKTAYHRALLLNHPDKAPKGHDETLLSPDQYPTSPQYSIDEIMKAFQTLVEPRLKVEYDKQLLSDKSRMKILGDETSRKGTHLGVETYDLEDLAYNDKLEQWSRPCRCGSEVAYKVTELDLEQESREGEIYVGCQGCSLFIKVLFAVAE